MGSLPKGVSVQEVSVQGSLSRGSLSRGVSVKREVSVQGVSVQGSLSSGSLSRGVSIKRGVSVQGGLCQEGGLCPGRSLSGRHPRDRDPPYGNERVVHILLACILIIAQFFEK